jgi:hypothetical protein
VCVPWPVAMDCYCPKGRRKKKPSMSATGILRKYFGQKDGQTTLEFAKELGALSPAEKRELAAAAAAQIGETLDAE